MEDHSDDMNKCFLSVPTWVRYTDLPTWANVEEHGIMDPEEVHVSGGGIMFRPREKRWYHVITMGDAWLATWIDCGRPMHGIIEAEPQDRWMPLSYLMKMPGFALASEIAPNDSEAKQSGED